jgi:hypothetical protein
MALIGTVLPFYIFLALIFSVDGAEFHFVLRHVVEAD